MILVSWNFFILNGDFQLRPNNRSGEKMKIFLYTSVLSILLVGAQLLAHAKPEHLLYYCTTPDKSDSSTQLIKWASASVDAESCITGLEATINLSEDELAAMHAVDPYSNEWITATNDKINSVKLVVNKSLNALATLKFDFSKLSNFPTRVQKQGKKTLSIKMNCQKDITF